MLYERELDNYKHKINELLKENSKVNVFNIIYNWKIIIYFILYFIFLQLSTSLEISLKQNEADLIMAKKNADLAKLNIEKIQHELENEKNLNNNLRTQVNNNLIIKYASTFLLKIKTVWRFNKDRAI